MLASWRAGLWQSLTSLTAQDYLFHSDKDCSQVTDTTYVHNSPQIYANDKTVEHAAIAKLNIAIPFVADALILNTAGNVISFANPAKF